MENDVNRKGSKFFESLDLSSLKLVVTSSQHLYISYLVLFILHLFRFTSKLNQSIV